MAELIIIVRAVPNERWKMDRENKEKERKGRKRNLSLFPSFLSFSLSVAELQNCKITLCRQSQSSVKCLKPIIASSYIFAHLNINLTNVWYAQQEHPNKVSSSDT